ncbi:MAG: EAL domain-containing protein [Janthinobacterium lividum]
MLGFLFLWSPILSAHAQFTRFQNFTDEQGLGNLNVEALAQDPDGYILLGTQAGLYRYDGTSIIPFLSETFAEKYVLKIIVDNAGRVWVVTRYGLYVRYGATFNKVDIGQSQFHLRSPHLFAVSGKNAVLDVDGRLLLAPVGTRSIGAFQPLFDSATMARVPELQKVQFVVSDAHDGFLIGCGVAICHEQAGHVTVLGEADGLSADTWQVALQTPDGTLWVRSLSRLARRKPGEMRFTVVNMPGDGGSGLIGSRIHTSYASGPSLLELLSDQHGGVLTQDMNGLIDWDGTTQHAYPHHSGGLPNSQITSLTFDREGSLWVGSSGIGAFRSIGMGNWEHLTEDDGLPSNTVWSITRLPNRQLWVATNSGAVAVDGAVAHLGNDTSYIAEATRGGRLWLAPSGSQLMRFDPMHGIIERLPSPGEVYDATMDRDNQLWIGTRTGLFLLGDADAPASHIHSACVLSGDMALVATDFSGTVWALSSKGVFQRDAAGHFILIVPSMLFRSTPQAMMFAPDGELWIGTAGSGVLRFHLTGNHIEQLSPLVAPVISSNNVEFVRHDHRGWIWLGTDRGVDVFDGRSWRHFDSSDGLITNDMDQGAVYEDTDGSMWFGTSHGLSHLIDPNRLPSQQTLHPYVTGLSLGEQTLSVSQSIHLDWTQDPLVIRFVDLDYSHERNIAFHYRLRGLDRNWNITTEHEIRYAALPTGKLQFELVAVDTVHGIASAPVGFTIHIRPPWWRRWWFYGLCVFAATATLFISWQARVRMLVRNQQRLEELVSARTGEIERAKNKLEHQAGELERQALSMQSMAMSDALTGLANRRAIMDALARAITAALMSEEPLAVLLYDIDHFKKINDGFGHLAGDEVLKVFGARLAAAVSTSEEVGRYGGEEFLVILRSDPDLVMHRVAAIHSAITDASYRFGDADRIVTSSGGLAFLRADDTGLSLMERADAALYRAKENGRNRIEKERPEGAAGKREPQAMVESSRNATLVPQDLLAALNAGEFVLHYQPIVDIDKDVVTACEALLRWQSPVRGTVLPGDFIPFAEEAGLMPEVGDWVLRTACREAARWRQPVKVAINLSPKQFRLPDLVDRVTAALAESGLPPERLELEVTETAMIDDMVAAAAMLQQLRGMGITIALDDFGTGYSSLNFLRTLPFDRIKIDRCFVQDLGVKPEASTIIRGLIALCAGLGAATTAEGVETDRQISLLRAEGCTEIQGFRIGRPRPDPEMQEWMAAFAASRFENRAQ